MKQNFQLCFFCSDSENGIKTQVWCTLNEHLLLQVPHVVNESNKAFSAIARLQGYIADRCITLLQKSKEAKEAIFKYFPDKIKQAGIDVVDYI